MFYHEGLDQNECRIHVYPAKNKAAVKYNSKQQWVYLFGLHCVDYFAKYMTRKSENQMKGIGKRLEHKWKREKQQIECIK